MIAETVEIAAIRVEAIRALYRQMRMGAVSAFIIIGYLVGTALPFTRWPVIAGWAVAALALQATRFVLLAGWRARAPADDRLETWARAYVVYQAASGAIYGATMLLFVHPAQPITVALTLACLFATTSGSLPALSYTPAAAHALVAATFAWVIGRLALLSEPGYQVMAIACTLFCLMMVGFTRNQKRVYDEGFRIRFENVALVDALREETARADEARLRAEAANLAKSQYLAAASHDLRQPLYALSLFAASLHELKLDADARRVVGQIGDNVAVMERLFEGLLDISRLEAGVVQPRLAPVGVDALFDRLSQVFWPQAEARGLQLRFRSDGEQVLSDPALLERTLANLLSNALRATTGGGVLVAARRRGAAIRFEVYDTGRGIPDEARTRIFDEFVQLDNAERDRSKGLGLGLAIVRRSLDLLDASVGVRSRVGRGSRFSFDQPVATGAAAPPATPAPVPQATMGGGGVLIVDDDAAVRLALGELLGRWGIAATLDASPAAALGRLAAGARFGTVMVDYRMPGDMDGLQFIAAARRGHPAPLPSFALVTGDVDPALLARARALDVPVLHKPLSREVLRHWLAG